MGKFSDYGMSKGSKNAKGGNFNGQRGQYGKGGSGKGYHNPGQYSSGNGRQDTVQGSPSAPYNFVSLNHNVLRSPLHEEIKELEGVNKIQSAFGEYICSRKTYTGYFLVDIKNVTPLYIAGAGGIFSDGKNLCIPGSSMRGCIKNLFKVMTNSSLRCNRDNADVYDRHLFFRSFASPFKPFNELYSDKAAIRVNGKMKAAAAAGFLVKKGKEYFICPADYTPVKTTVQIANPPKPKVQWKADCAEVYTGPMNFNKKDPKKNKKHFYVVKNPVWSKAMELSKELISDYGDDKNRKGLDLFNSEYGLKRNEFSQYQFLNGAANYDYIIPCFYSAENDQVKNFGAGPYYRMPYDKSIGKHIPEAVRTEDIDFTDAVFGLKEYWASRVYFEDLYLRKDCDGTLEQEDYRKVLGTPNPTSFQNYLKTENGKACHWDGVSEIRGYKMYWHRPPHWQGVKNEKNDNFNFRIAPLKPGRHFIGRVRFENLTGEELGALASVFALGNEQDCCFKLGMGKPIGLGSIKVTSRLFLKNETYYTTLFTDRGFASEQEEDSSRFVGMFESYLKQNSDAAETVLYRNRMQELRKITDINYMNKAGWEDKTRYLDINDRDDKKVANARIPLPDISEVVGVKK